MTSLINKSNHPVNIKRISVRVWTLRDEIEAAISKRIEEQGLENVDIEDIKNFYSSLKPRMASLEDSLDDDELEEMNIQPGIEDNSTFPETDEETPENEAEDKNGEEDKKEDENSEAAAEMAEEVLNQDGEENGSAQPGFPRVLPSPDKITGGFAFLSEVHMEQILFFGKRAFTKGQSIVVEFLIPNNFSVSAEVVSAFPIDRTSKIISDTKPTHRIQGNFNFLFDGERGALRDFLKSVEPEVPPPPKRLKRPDSEDDEDDDFDDLGF